MHIAPKPLFCRPNRHPGLRSNSLYPGIISSIVVSACYVNNIIGRRALFYTGVYERSHHAACAYRGAPATTSPIGAALLRGAFQ